MSDEHPADMLARLGSDGLLWAQEFNKTAVRLGYSEMDEGWLIGWFANAIENSCNPLRNEVDALRAELAAERKNNKSFNKHLTRARGNTQTMKAERDALRAERDALRALLREARESIYDTGLQEELVASIDAALKGDGDE